MHGILNPDTADVSATRTHAGHAVIEFLKRRRRWLLVVAAPTALVAGYYGLIAAPQYESEAHFVVRSSQGSTPQPSGLGAALSMVGAASPAQSEGMSVSDYLSSHDAVDTLVRKGNLVERYQRPEADFLSRLRPENPTPETTLKYFRSRADVKLDTDTGITTMRVRAFRPTDAYAIMSNMLALGEARVNMLNQRAYASSLGVARRQLAEAEAGVTQSQQALTGFRQTRRNIDPVATGEAQIGVVSTLQGALAQARAQQATMAGAISPNSPQARAMNAQVRSLEAQVAAESGRLTGGGTAIAANVGGYQELELRQQFAAKQYEVAATGVQRAREQAEKQQLFIVRIVEPNMPGKALYPKSLSIILTVFLALSLAYGVGWLIAAGVREHAA